MSYFHAYSFNIFRQLGANFELLGHYLRWLNLDGRSDPGLIANMVAACNRIATESMVLEFRLARACSRGKEDRGESSLDVLEHAYTVLFDGLDEAFPVTRIEPYAEVAAQQSQYNLALDA